MKKNNTRTTVAKQRKQVASKARRKRRVAARDLVVRRKLQPLATHIRGLEKQVSELKELLASLSPKQPAEEKA